MATTMTHDVTSPLTDTHPGGRWAEAVMDRIYAEGDYYSGWFLFIHFGIGLALAPFYDTWLMALGVGVLALAMFFVCRWLAPRTLLTRWVAGISLQVFVALHIYQMHGLYEMHFFFFSAFTMLIAYQDWRAPWPGAILIIGQHLWFAMLANSGIDLGFFPGRPGAWQLFFHFGIALLHVAVCSHWAMRLRRDTLREAWDQHRLDLALQKAEAAVAAKGNFLATMSHEIRTPMNGVLGVMTLLEQTSLNPEQRDYVGIARRSGEGLLAIIDDILDFSKLEAGRMTVEDLPFRLRHVFEDLHALLLPKARERRIAFTCQVEDDVPDVLSSDCRRLRQILLNIVGNALKFTCEGHVTVRARLVERAGAEGILQITVEDTGIGMDADAVGRLFVDYAQADETTTRRFGGTGLGMAISQRLALLLGGAITVDSTPGEGTTFTLSMPVLLDVVMPEQAIDSHLGHRPRQDDMPPQVLLVDDNAVNQLVARRLLEREGCVVVVAADGAAALAELAQASFDVVLMDCHMPVMDGFEATRQLRASDGPMRHVRVIALTASVMDEDRRQCLDAGMNGVLAKPIARHAIADLVRELRTRKRTLEADLPVAV